MLVGLPVVKGELPASEIVFVDEPELTARLLAGEDELLESRPLFANEPRLLVGILVADEKAPRVDTELVIDPTMLAELLLDDEPPGRMPLVVDEPALAAKLPPGEEKLPVPAPPVFVVEPAFTPAVLEKEETPTVVAPTPEMVDNPPAALPELLVDVEVPPDAPIFDIDDKIVICTALFTPEEDALPVGSAIILVIVDALDKPEACPVKGMPVFDVDGGVLELANVAEFAVFDG